MATVAWVCHQRGTDDTPYWRTLKVNGELNEKYPVGIEAQRKKPAAEGRGIISKGQKSCVIMLKTIRTFCLTRAANNDRFRIAEWCAGSRCFVGV